MIEISFNFLYKFLFLINGYILDNLDTFKLPLMNLYNNKYQNINIELIRYQIPY